MAPNASYRVRSTTTQSLTFTRFFGKGRHSQFGSTRTHPETPSRQISLH
jgi:hypothetical protein